VRLAFLFPFITQKEGIMPDTETTEPVEKTEETQYEVKVAKADYDALQARLRNADGYTARQVQETEKRIRKEYEDKMRNLSTGDTDLDAVRRKVLETEQRNQEKERELTQRALHLTALDLSNKYRIDMTELAGFNKEDDMRVKAMTLYTERLESERATPQTKLDSGGGKSIGGGFTISRIKDMSPEEWQENRKAAWAAVQEGKIKE